jgi:hypothetical protein
MYMRLAVVLLTMPLPCDMILLDADYLILTALVSVFFSARTEKRKPCSINLPISARESPCDSSKGMKRAFLIGAGKRGDPFGLIAFDRR